MHGSGKTNWSSMFKIGPLICCLFLVSTILLGQNTETFSDTKSGQRPGIMWYYTGLRPAKTEKVRKYDRLVFDLTQNDWIGENKTLENRTLSLGITTNFLFDIPLTTRNTVSLGTGISHTLFRLRHRGQFTAEDAHTSFTLPINSTIDKAVLVGNSIAVPIEIRFRTKGWRHFKLHLGMKLGYQFGLFSKTIVEEANGKITTKDASFPDINRFMSSVHMRIGIRNWALFGSYALRPIFSNVSSTQLHVFQTGISISLF